MNGDLARQRRPATHATCCISLYKGNSSIRPTMTGRKQKKSEDGELLPKLYVRRDSVDHASCKVARLKHSMHDVCCNLVHTLSVRVRSQPSVGPYVGIQPRDTRNGRQGRQISSRQKSPFSAPEDRVDGDGRQRKVGAAVRQRAAQVASRRLEAHREQLQRAQSGCPAGVRPGAKLQKLPSSYASQPPCLQHSPSGPITQASTPTKIVAKVSGGTSSAKLSYAGILQLH